MWGIWLNVAGDWLRELPRRGESISEAILAFESEDGAKDRAAEHYGSGSYAEVRGDGYCEVKKLVKVVG